MSFGDEFDSFLLHQIDSALDDSLVEFAIHVVDVSEESHA